MTKQPILQIENLSFYYGNRLVLEDINLTLQSGEFLGLIGPNGSGKSTLLKILLGLLPPAKGEVRLFGQSLSHFRDWHRIGYVAQKANSFNSGFPATVFEVVSMGLFGKMGLGKWLGKKEKEKIERTIEMVGLSAYARQNIGKLSGGQQQRAFIARALVSDPELLILDEPTVGVDALSVEQFYDLLQNMHRDKGISLILVSHDVGAISAKVDRVACLNRKLHFHGDAKEFEHYRPAIFNSMYGHDVHVLEHHH